MTASTTFRRAEAIELLRANLRLLNELAPDYATPKSRKKALQIRSPQDIVSMLGPEMRALEQEELRVAMLTIRNELIGTTLVYRGSINSVQVRIADVFREAVRRNAAAIVVLHNHPSGDPTPSVEDCKISAAMNDAGTLLGVELLDHMVVARNGDVSLRQRRLGPWR